MQNGTDSSLIKRNSEIKTGDPLPGDRDRRLMQVEEHHKRAEVATNRPAYREARREKAVKVGKTTCQPICVPASLSP